MRHTRAVGGCRAQRHSHFGPEQSPHIPLSTRTIWKGVRCGYRHEGYKQPAECIRVNITGVPRDAGSVPIISSAVDALTPGCAKLGFNSTSCARSTRADHYLAQREAAELRCWFSSFSTAKLAASHFISSVKSQNKSYRSLFNLRTI